MFRQVSLVDVHSVRSMAHLSALGCRQLHVERVVFGQHDVLDLQLPLQALDRFDVGEPELGQAFARLLHLFDTRRERAQSTSCAAKSVKKRLVIILIIISPHILHSFCILEKN